MCFCCFSLCFPVTHFYLWVFLVNFDWILDVYKILEGNFEVLKHLSQGEFFVLSSQLVEGQILTQVEFKWFEGRLIYFSFIFFLAFTTKIPEYLPRPLLLVCLQSSLVPHSCKMLRRFSVLLNVSLNHILSGFSASWLLINA